MKRSALLLAALVVASLAVFWPTLGAGFITDDFPIVKLNPVVHRGDLVEIFGTGWWEAVGGVGAGLYRPVTVASWLLERGADGHVRPERAHLHNVLLNVVAYNERGIRAYRRAGFREVGRRRQAWWLGGQAHDVVIMDCLATEFSSSVLQRYLPEHTGTADT